MLRFSEYRTMINHLSETLMLNDIQISSDYMSRWVVLKRRVGAVRSQRVLKVLFYVNILQCFFVVENFTANAVCVAIGDNGNRLIFKLWWNFFYDLFSIKNIADVNSIDSFVSKAKRMFKKWYLPNWTEELFTVVKYIETRPPVYLVKDDHGEILEETFYAKEILKVIQQDDVYKIQSVPKKRRNGRRVQYLVKWFGYPESVNSWIFKPNLQKRGVAVWSVSLVNGTEWHGQHIVLGHLWKKDTSTRDRISVSGTHPVHGYRSQHLQLDGRIGEQYFEDGTVELFAIFVT